MAICTWTEVIDGRWITGCGQEFEFRDGGLDENEFEFCPWYCRDLVDGACIPDTDDAPDPEGRSRGEL